MGIISRDSRLGTIILRGNLIFYHLLFIDYNKRGSVLSGNGFITMPGSQ